MPSAKNSSGARICAPVSGGWRMSTHSSSVSGPALRSTPSGTPILPRAWRGPACATASRAEAGRPGGRGETPRERRHALGVPARVAITRLEGVGESEQAVEEGLLHAPVRLLQISRVAQRLAMRVAEARVRVLELTLALLPHLADGLEVAGVGEGLGEGYVCGHSVASGSSDRTRVNSASGEKGLVR